MYLLLTGSTDGIGFETAKVLAQKGYNLIIHGRSSKKLYSISQILSTINPSIDIIPVVADFASLNETYEAFLKIKDLPVNILINNAGTFVNEFKRTVDGFEYTYQVNHLSHFLITHILLETIINNAPSKIIIVASMAHASSIDFDKLKKGVFPTGYEAYYLSKLCNILFSFKLHDMLKDKGVIVNSLHPGVINTKLLKKGWGACGVDVKEGYKTILHLIENVNKGGCYFRDFLCSQAAAIAYNKSIQDECYHLSASQLDQAGITL
ncbi:SDR family NAD(P)-dependent oxidoreductase [Hippea jasoniae]|uniref:SDR family NAD(P)-dependent oxidoreductase n=1 Tax=Hippea jasoniae TaxID=944479 RepID=UPI000554F089|nr:SDR family NAD(P)-dependent oxidoreductase [Hippea jasoniae]